MSRPSTLPGGVLARPDYETLRPQARKQREPVGTKMDTPFKKFLLADPGQTEWDGLWAWMILSVWMGKVLIRPLQERGLGGLVSVLARAARRRLG